MRWLKPENETYLAELACDLSRSELYLRITTDFMKDDQASLSRLVEIDGGSLRPEAYGIETLRRAGKNLDEIIRDLVTIRANILLITEGTHGRQEEQGQGSPDRAGDSQALASEQPSSGESAPVGSGGG